ncbi:MAG: 3,4-dihydroxy-2-butanone-4-phosphate synthase [Pseudomonadota bacterium]
MDRDLSHVKKAIEAFKMGEMLVVTDDDDRENEGDLFVAAEHCTPEAMAFIVRHTSGIVCAPMPVADARRLRLDPMVSANDAPLGTAFTISVDVRHGLTTGISAEERTNTVRALANGNIGAEDFVRPGHVFPLIAREGGVLVRSGHTEACVDLCQLAGLQPVGVLAELVNDDGTVKRGQQVTDFADEHDLKMVSVADLIAFRQRSERLVSRVDEGPIDTPFGPAKAYSYSVPFDAMQHLAVVFGDIEGKKDVPVRLHLEQVAQDVFGAQTRLNKVLKRMASSECGVVVYLREGSVGVANVSARHVRTASGVEDDHETANQRQSEWREIGLGAQILRDLGLTSIKLVASQKRTYVGLEGFGITISQTELV